MPVTLGTGASELPTLAGGASGAAAVVAQPPPWESLYLKPAIAYYDWLAPAPSPSLAAHQSQPLGRDIAVYIGKDVIPASFWHLEWPQSLLPDIYFTAATSQPLGQPIALRSRDAITATFGLHDWPTPPPPNNYPSYMAQPLGGESAYALLPFYLTDWPNPSPPIQQIVTQYLGTNPFTMFIPVGPPLTVTLGTGSYSLSAPKLYLTEAPMTQPRFDWDYAFSPWESAYVAAIGYNPVETIMLVQFQSGQSSTYAPVSPTAAQAFADFVATGADPTQALRNFVRTQ